MRRLCRTKLYSTYLDVLAGVLGRRETVRVHCVEDSIQLVSS